MVTETKKTNSKITPEFCKKFLRHNDWSWRRAASALDCSYTHFAFVLTGRRASRLLLNRIAALPKSPEPYKVSGFAYRRNKI